MIAKQAVYLTQDRQTAVPEGHKDAKFLLVREGHEIDEALVEKHDAADLVGSVSKVKAPEPEPIPPPTLKGDAAAEGKKAAEPAKKKAAKKRAAKK